MVGWGPWGVEFAFELSFRIGRVGTLGEGLGTRGLNLNLVSSLKFNLSFRVDRVGILGGGLGWDPRGRVGDPGG